MITLNRYLGVAVGVSILMIAACSGGNDDNDGSAVAGAGGGGDTATNPFIPFLGTWSSGCVVTTPAPRPGSLSNPPRSELVTATLGNLSGVDKATVSIDDKNYYGSDTCDPAKLDQSGTVSGQVTAQTTTKVITGDPTHLKTGTAQTASFRLDSVSLHQVTLNFAPAVGASSQVGYMLEDGKLYGVSGSRQADGLGKRFANIPLMKQ